MTLAENYNYSFIASVVVTGDLPLHSNLFASFRKNLKWHEEGIQGHGETDLVKNLMKDSL
jgi:hypothetical protein